MIAESYRDLEEDCRKLGDMLRLGKPVPGAVFVAATQDPDYARKLFVCREAPPLLAFLLDNPPSAGVPGAAEAAPLPREHSTAELVAKASKSFWEWTKSGFRIIDDATYAKRISACRTCPNLIDHPDKPIYALVAARDDKICSACGCTVAKKAKLPHETCPVADPGRPGFNKWGEAIPAAHSR